jgi:5'-3' exonuclease
MLQVDGIPGVRGVGPKTAVALLRAFGSLEGIYSSLDSIGRQCLLNHPPTYEAASTSGYCHSTIWFFYADPPLPPAESLPVRGAKSLKKKLVEQRDEAFLYRQVVTLMDNLDLPYLKALTRADLRCVHVCAVHAHGRPGAVLLLCVMLNAACQWQVSGAAPPG